MNKQPLLTRTELEVAQALWKLGQGTVREIFESIPNSKGIDFWTVQTLLRRLETKEYVRSTKNGAVRIYRPRIQQKTVVRRLTSDFLRRVFGGNTFPLFQHLIKERDLTVEEMQRLRDLLDEEIDDRK